MHMIILSVAANNLTLSMLPSVAVFGLAVTVKAFGETLYNDTHLFHHFWEITEFILNTLLFTLAGLVWTFELAKFSDWKDWVSECAPSFSPYIASKNVSQNCIWFLLNPRAT